MAVLVPFRFGEDAVATFDFPSEGRPPRRCRGVCRVMFDEKHGLMEQQ